MAISIKGLVALAWLQAAEPKQPRQLLVQVSTPIHFGSLGRRSLVCRTGPRQDQTMRTTAAPSPILWSLVCLVWWLWPCCRRSQSDQDNCWSKWAHQFTLAYSAHSAHSLVRSSLVCRAGLRPDPIKRTKVGPSPTLLPSACQVWLLFLCLQPEPVLLNNCWSKNNGHYEQKIFHIVYKFKFLISKTL